MPWVDPLSFQKKIDFYPGAHGNFLELLLNIYACPLGIDSDRPLFDINGASHLKYSWYGQKGFRQNIGCHHYSVLDMDLDAADNVIEISVEDAHKITVIVNADLRAGNQKVDIVNPEINTLEKFQHLPKKRPWVDWLVREYGSRQDYPRSAFRNLYHQEFGTDMNHFKHLGTKMTFPHSCFFDFQSLIEKLGDAAVFFDLDFCPDDKMLAIWQEFIDKNQGLKAKLRCDKLFDDLVQGRDADLTNLSVAEESWLLYRLWPDQKDAWLYFEQFDLIKKHARHA